MVFGAVAGAVLFGTVVDMVDAPLPPCAVEDGSTGPLPCFWNGGPNGVGATFVIGADGLVRAAR